jgi:transposase
MTFASLDLHKKEVEAALVDDQGNILHRSRFPATREALEAFARLRLGGDTAVAVEATTNTWPVAAILQPLVQKLVVSNPLRTKAIACAKIKKKRAGRPCPLRAIQRDKVDALTLAQLLRTGYLPEVWIPGDETRLMRQRSTERAMLSADRTRIKNRIHSVLHQRLIEAPPGDLFSVANLAWLKALPLDPFGRDSLDRHLRQLERVELEMTALTQQIAVHAHQTPQVKLLMTLPGVDFTVAETILAALGDTSRFETPDKAAAYLGLVPSTRQSGDHCYHGPITKQGARHARWLLVQAAQHAALHPGPIGAFFRRIAKKKNRNVAVVAVAHKLVVLAWHLLKNNEPYRYAQPQTIQAKLSRLRILATNQKRRTGLTKGQPRTAQYGKGCTKAIPALDQIYAAEALPPLAAELKAGEHKMLEQHGVAAHAKAVRTPRRVPRAPKARP